MFVSQSISDRHKELLAQRKAQDPSFKEAYNEKNPFERIISAQLETSLVDETPYAVTIKNDKPRADSYHLVLPVYPARNIIDFLSNAPDEDKVGYYQALSKLVKEMTPVYQTRLNELNGSCSRIVFNIGAYSQNTVDYCHAHVTGDYSPVKAEYLILPEIDFKAYEKEVEREFRYPNPEPSQAPQLRPSYLANRIDFMTDGTTSWFQDGYTLTQREGLSLTKEHPASTILSQMVILANLLQAKDKLALDLRQENSGARLVIDTDVQGQTRFIAGGNTLLQKLPQTPLTTVQQQAYLLSLCERYRGN